METAFAHNAVLRDLARPATGLVTILNRQLNYQLQCIRNAWHGGRWETRPTVQSIRANETRAIVLLHLLFEAKFIEAHDYSKLHAEVESAFCDALKRRRHRTARTPA